MLGTGLGRLSQVTKLKEAFTMKATTKRLLALVLVLCTMLALGMRTVPYAQAAEELPEGIVYGAADQTTFVPAGYTYVFEDENGMGYTYEAEGDMYISERVLTAEEAEALAKLDCRGDSMVQPDGTVCKTFSATGAPERIFCTAWE